MRILVTGAGGFIGRHLVPRLVADGHTVFPFRRGEGSAPTDLAAIGSWRGWPADAEAVVHLAALNPSRRDGASRDAAWLASANVEGTRAVAERAALEGVRRFVFLSTALVHSPSDGRPIAEDDALAPQNPYAASKAAAEAALWDVASRTGLEACVLRAPSVYGPGGRGSIATLVRLARTRLPVPLDTRAPRSVISVGNVVDAIVAALKHPDADGETFLLADAEPLSLGDMVALMHAGLGREPRVLPFPRRLLGALAGRLGKGDAFERLAGSFVLNTARIRDRLGWLPLETSEEAFGRLIRDETGINRDR